MRDLLCTFALTFCVVMATTATVGVARAIGSTYPKLRVDGSELIGLQKTAHDQWRDSFNAYLVKVGASRPPITEEWPID